MEVISPVTGQRTDRSPPMWAEEPASIPMNWYDDAALTSPIGQTTATATGLGAGTYWVEVTDENGCTISGSVTLTEPAVVAVTAAVSSYL